MLLCMPQSAPECASEHLKLENVEHCEGEPDTEYYVIHQVNHPPTCTSIYHSQGTLKVFLLAGLLICHGI